MRDDSLGFEDCCLGTHLLNFLLSLFQTMLSNFLPDQFCQAGHDRRDGPLDEGLCAVPVERVFPQIGVPSELMTEVDFWPSFSLLNLITNHDPKY